MNFCELMVFVIVFVLLFVCIESISMEYYGMRKRFMQTESDICYKYICSESGSTACFLHSDTNIYLNPTYCPGIHTLIYLYPKHTYTHAHITHSYYALYIQNIQHLFSKIHTYIHTFSIYLSQHLFSHLFSHSFIYLFLYLFL